MSRRNHELDAVTQELRTAGIQFVVTRKKHYKVNFQHGGRERLIVVSFSASDHRAAMNARSFVRRLLRSSGAQKGKSPP